jgi:hypothetical protein
LNRKLCSEEKTSNDLNIPFKEYEKEGGERRSQLNGQWKVLMLDGPWKVPLFGGQWKVLMFDGPWKVPLLGG